MCSQPRQETLWDRQEYGKNIASKSDRSGDARAPGTNEQESKTRYSLEFQPVKQAWAASASVGHGGKQGDGQGMSGSG